jgi:flagellin-like protein
MKGISEIISAVLVVLIAIALVSMAYTWGLPLIQKARGEAIAERVHTYFNPDNAASLQSKMMGAVNLGGESVFNLDVDGIWILLPPDASTVENNSIQFTFFSKVSKVGYSGEWIPIFGGGCDPSPRYLGVDRPYVTCARASALGDGYNITYKVQFRELIDTSDPTYKTRQTIRIVSLGPTASTGKYVRISRGDTRKISEDDKNLIITELKIILG